jgi:hypothetical protein
MSKKNIIYLACTLALLLVASTHFAHKKYQWELSSKKYQEGIIEGQEMYEAGEVILDSITNVPTHIRVKRACGIPDHITWSEVHKSRKWRRKVAEKCKQYGIRVEPMHR